MMPRQQPRMPMSPRGMPPQQMNPMQGARNMGPMMRNNAPSRGGGAGGGLLSKLLGGNRGAANTMARSGAATNVVNAATRSGGASGGILKSLANPTAINGFLANSQKFLNTAGQIGPMINQYGPMVRNIPAMWKLYRGLKDKPETKEETKNIQATETMVETATPSVAKQIIPTEENIEIQPKRKEPTNRGSSMPKLYV